MLKQRILSAAILFFVFLVSFFSDNSLYFIVLIFIVGGILLYELGRILKLKSLALIIYWTLSIIPIVFFYLLFNLEKNYFSDQLLNYFSVNFSILISFISLIFWVLLAPMDIRYKKISSNIKFQIFYGYLLVTPMVIVTTMLFTQNKILLLITFIMIWIADSGAYFIGKKFGRHKLAITLSPGKTIEGALGGFISNIICAFMIAYFFEVDFIIMLSLAIMVTSLSIYGDIYQSFLKRQAHVKDSGSIIPGHGGLLDRFDSFCPTLPILYLTYTYLYIYIPSIPIV